MSRAGLPYQRNWRQSQQDATEQFFEELAQMCSFGRPMTKWHFGNPMMVLDSIAHCHRTRTTIIPSANLLPSTQISHATQDDVPLKILKISVDM
jgi:hypothetical protein